MAQSLCAVIGWDGTRKPPKMRVLADGFSSPGKDQRDLRRLLVAALYCRVASRQAASESNDAMCMAISIASQ